MKEKDLKRIIKEAVEESLQYYGFTTDSPNQVQQDMIHLRKLRLGCEATKLNIIRAFITVTLPAALYIIWQTFKEEISK